MTISADVPTTEAGPPSFPMPRTCPFHPPAQYADLRASEPVSRVVLPTGRTAWLVTRHDLARQLLADPRVSVNRAHPAYPGVIPQGAAFTQRPPGFLTWMDPPEHTQHKKMLINEFTGKRLSALRPWVQASVDECVDAMLAAGDHGELVEDLALPVPTMVITELLGVPYEDRKLFQERTTLIVNLTNSPEARTKALGEMGAYLSKLIQRKAAEPVDDLISRLVAKYKEAGTYDHTHMTGLVTLLLTGGFETTANMIALGIVALLEHPEERDKLMADTSIAPRTADEMLRFFSVSDYATGRVLTEDMELGGVHMRAGDGVLAPNGAANRDAAVFPEPDRLDVARDEARHHLAFGYGIHQCIGQNLAHLELQVAYTRVFERLPTLRLAVPLEELRFKQDTNFYGVHEVPVTW